MTLAQLQDKIYKNIFNQKNINTTISSNYVSQWSEYYSSNKELPNFNSSICNLSPKSFLNNMENYSINISNTTSYTKIEEKLIKYIWNSIFDIIAISDINKKITKFEVKYKTSSEDFYQKWVNGEYEDNWDTNEWLNLYIQFKKS